MTTKPKICFFCNGSYQQGLQITEVSSTEIIVFQTCPECGAEYLAKEDLIAEQKKIKTRKCQCGMTYNMLRKLGRAGCSLCYECFADALGDIINRCQADNLHVGKQAKPLLNVEQQIHELRIKRARAIELEKYEEAGLLTDELKRLGSR